MGPKQREKNQSIKTDRIDTDKIKIAENDIRTVCDCIPYVQKEKQLCEKY